MRKTVVAGAVALAVIAAAVVSGQAARAQGPDRLRSTAPFLLLQGPGSAIGVTVRDLRAEEIESAKIETGGVAIDTVREGGPAAQAGFRAGDVVAEFDGERVRSARHFSRLVNETPPGRRVAAVVLRAGNRETLQVTVAADDRVSLDLPEVRRQFEPGLRSVPRDFSFDFNLPQGVFPLLRGAQLGVSLTPLSDQLATFFGVRDGVLVSSVQEGSAAAQAGMRAGDVITAINGRAVASVADVTVAVRDADPGSAIEIRVMRDKQETTLKATRPSEPQRLRPGRNQVPI